MGRNYEELDGFIEKVNSMDTSVQFKGQLGGKELSYLDLKINAGEEI